MSTNETWALEPPLDATVQFVAQLPNDLIGNQSIDTVRIRASCGGRYAPFGPDDVGADLLGWIWSRADTRPGRWQSLARTDVAVPNPAVWPRQGFVDFRSEAVAADLARGLINREGRVYVQCRPAGVSDAAALAEVTADYIEVRVSYAAGSP